MAGGRGGRGRHCRLLRALHLSRAREGEDTPGPPASFGCALTTQLAGSHNGASGSLDNEKSHKEQSRTLGRSDPRFMKELQRLQSCASIDRTASSCSSDASRVRRLFQMHIRVPTVADDAVTVLEQSRNTRNGAKKTAKNPSESDHT